MVYAVGTVVTMLLSNDATAVVLTPAVYAATRAAGAPPLPYLFICAFIANAASFALPISNPANLVVFGARMPPLLEWLCRFGPASLVSIAVTYLVLRPTQQRALATARIACDIERQPLGRGGRMAAGGIVAVGACLLMGSAFDVALGWPTFICASVTSAAIVALNRQSPWPVLRNVSWDVCHWWPGCSCWSKASIAAA
jgi:arsenical pump membrane protein